MAARSGLTLKPEEQKEGGGSNSYCTLNVIKTKHILEPASRPTFINAGKLKRNLACGICNDVVYKPQTTVCGSKVCAPCIEKEFGEKETIPCPLNRDGRCNNQPCQKSGLKKSHVVTDVLINKSFTDEICQCENHKYGCIANPTWANLNTHQAVCKYVPQKCTNQGCSMLISRHILRSHVMDHCEHALDDCKKCGTKIKKKDIKKHSQKCKAKDYCVSCKETFPDKEHLEYHQKIFPSCIKEAGKCYFYNKCGFETTNVNSMKTHMKEASEAHYSVATTPGKLLSGLSIQVPLKSNTSLKGTELFQTASPGNIQVAPNSQNSSAKSINDVSRKKASSINYEGRLLWQISDYREKKKMAELGKGQLYISSSSFYSSPKGYKMRCRVYLNGDGCAKDQYLSVYFILMKGEFDDYLSFPFQQRISFKLICPYDESKNKTEYLSIAGNEAASRRPLGYENIASGIPLFASHKEIDAWYVKKNSIQIEVKVI